MSFARNLFVFAVIAFAISLLLSHPWSVRGSEAAEFAPQTHQTTLVPSQTGIHVILPYGMAESSKSGDRVVGFVSAPVRINDEIAVPSGTQVKGTIARIQEKEGKAAVELDFSQLVVNDSVTEIQTEPVIASVPVETDFEVLGQA